MNRDCPALEEGRDSVSVRPRVALVLPRGETFRNFVYTECVRELAKTCELLILAVCPNRRLFAIVEESGRVVELDAPARPWLVRFCEELLDIVHGRWLWSEAAKQRWKEQVRVGGLRHRLAMRFKHGVARAIYFLGGLGWLSRVHEGLNLRWGSSEKMLMLLREFDPDLVFNASHSHSKNALGTMYAAKQLNLPSATFLFSWDNLTSQGRIYPLYDYYLAWTDRIEGDLLRFYPTVDPGKVRVTGTPQFDAHFDSKNLWDRDRFCQHVGLDPSRPYVLYTTSMSHHFPHERVIIVRIAKMLEEMKDQGAPVLFVRLYGKEKHPEYFEGLEGESKNIVVSPMAWERRWETPLPEDAALYTNTLRHAAVGINAASTVSLELCMFDKPVLNVAYNPPGRDVSPKDYRVFYGWEHYKPVVDSGAVEVAWSEEEMKRLLQRALEDPSRLSTVRARFVREFFGEFLDGKSAQRVAAALQEFALLARQ